MRFIPTAQDYLENLEFKAFSVYTLNDKQYFSNQLRDLKNSKETEFN